MRLDQAGTRQIAAILKMMWNNVNIMKLQFTITAFWNWSFNF